MCSDITACQIDEGGPEVMQVSDANHFGETHEYMYDADKSRNIIRANMKFEFMITGFWLT